MNSFSFYQKYNRIVQEGYNQLFKAAKAKEDAEHKYGVKLDTSKAEKMTEEQRKKIQSNPNVQKIEKQANNFWSSIPIFKSIFFFFEI